MADKTKIDWCDASWNPVTGCLHGCEYCYARRMVHRFGGLTPDNDLHVLDDQNYDARGNKDIYPFGFAPTLHRYRMDFPKRLQRPRTIFVCSMADLFGKWVPDKWIREVMEACRAAPQHQYLFLTKNPARYGELAAEGKLPKEKNHWYGITATDHQMAEANFRHIPNGWDAYNIFLSAEPLHGEINIPALNSWPKWVIFGAETGNRQGKIIPEKAWIDNAVQMCRNIGAAVFMKESLREIMGPDFIQEYPWGDWK